VTAGAGNRAAAGRLWTSGTTIAALLLSLLAAGIVYRYWPSEERQVRRHLVHLAEALSVPGRETEVEHMTRVAVLREFFAPDVRVVIDGRVIGSSDALFAALTAWTPPPGGFSVDFVDQTVTMATDRAAAQVALTARVMAKDLETGEAIVEARDVTLSMVNTPGDWVITAAEAVAPPGAR
jgi:hypothetical protein